MPRERFKRSPTSPTQNQQTKQRRESKHTVARACAGSKAPWTNLLAMAASARARLMTHISHTNPITRAFRIPKKVLMPADNDDARVSLTRRASPQPSGKKALSCRLQSCAYASLAAAFAHRARAALRGRLHQLLLQYNQITSRATRIIYFHHNTATLYLTRESIRPYQAVGRSSAALLRLLRVVAPTARRHVEILPRTCALGTSLQRCFDRDTTGSADAAGKHARVRA